MTNPTIRMMPGASSRDVVCVSAPLGFRVFVGKRGKLAHIPGATPSTDIFLTELEIDTELRSVNQPVPEDGWVFKDVPMTYDADAFARDLDLAINRVTQIFNDSLSRGPINPKLRSGMPPEEAIADTCLALTIRKASERQLREWFAQVMEETRSMLIAKNAQYGDSALNPLRIFSTATPHEQLLVRMDDKVSRMSRGAAAGEDPANDLFGYLILMLISEARGQFP